MTTLSADQCCVTHTFHNTSPPSFNVSTTGSDASNMAASVLISDELWSKLDIFLNCFLVHVLSALGIVGNVMNILVLTRYGQKQTTNLILTSLSVTDLVCSVLQPFRRLQCLVAQFDLGLSVTYRTFSTIYLYTFVDICVALSICHVAAIAIERFTAVFFPLHVNRIFTIPRVRWVIVFIYLYTIALLAPMFSRLSYQWFFDEKFNVWVSRLTLSKFYSQNYDTINFYSNFIVNNLFSSVSLFMILICSLAITVKLTTGESKRLTKSSTTASKKIKEAKVAKMLLTVCLTTVVTYLPSAVIYMCLLYANITILSSGNLYSLLQSVICVLFQFNAAVNFLIYVTMSSKFAAGYRRLISRKKL
ncbi:neuropeptide FF receptor 2-like [Physella acuta]|uniref:neuropeptide FF receptor 2-like n=1 Tax=Physella acuta TaxID=109671 RepID=UPI0027DABAB3|nr:neuropeptide FF receptor 2-like [Physella acuta]